VQATCSARRQHTSRAAASLPTCHEIHSVMNTRMTSSKELL
jgi:hypothetical protein